MSTVDSILAVVGAVAVTYLFHSTLLLSIAWCLDKRHLFGLAICEQIWKSAAVIGIVTSVAQVAVIAANPELGSGSLRIDVRQLEQLEGDGRVSPDRPPTTTGRGVAHLDDDRKRDEPLRSVASESKGTLGGRGIVPTGEATRLPAPIRTGVRHHDTVSLQLNKARDTGYLHQIVSIALHTVAIAAFILLCGGFGRAGIQLLSLRQRYRNLEVVSHGPAFRSLDAILRRNAIRTKVRLVVDSRPSEPLAFGFFRWTIVLPKRMFQYLKPEELEALLAHEVAHLVRGDFWWLWIGKLLCCCLPFQPLNFVARRRWQATAEHLCDEWAVEHVVERVSLARCLVQVAEWQMEPRRGMVVYASGQNETTVALRVRRLLQEKSSQPTSRHSLRFVKTGAAVLGCLVVLFAPGAALPISASTTSPVVAGTDGILDSDENGPSPATLQHWRSLERDLRRLDEQFAILQALIEGAELDRSARKVAADIQLHSDRLRRQSDRLRKVVVSSRTGLARPRK